MTPHPQHSIVEIRICGAPAGRAGDVAANLERQILVPESVLCRGSVTRHISGILVREQGVTDNDGDRGESVGSEENSTRGGVDVRVDLSRRRA